MFEKILESAVASYLPGLEKMTEKRMEELAQMRKKVRSHPKEVEDWFEKEMSKLGNANVRNIIEDLKEKGEKVSR